MFKECLQIDRKWRETHILDLQRKIISESFFVKLVLEVLDIKWKNMYNKCSL